MNNPITQILKKWMSDDQPPEKLGLALGGGGARGFAQLGAVEAFNELGWTFNEISGTSAGAISGAFLADGKSPGDILTLLKKKDFFGLSQFRWPVNGLFTLTGLKKMIKDHIKVNRIEDLAIPLTVTAANLNTGKVTYFNNGSLEDCVVASASIPFIYEPVKINGDLYADGGIFDNLPYKPLTQNCTKIVAINISPITKNDDLDNMVKVASRAFQLAINSHHDEIADDKFVLIQPEGIENYELFDSNHVDELFELGYTAVKKLLGKSN
jgi:NTE family protein